MNRIFWYGAFLLLFASCAHKNTTQEFLNEASHISLFIQQPSNVMIHQNVGPVLYQVMWDHCSRVGYHLTDTQYGGYTLQTKIVSYEIPDKFVSPDVVVYGYRIKMTVECQLFDENMKKIDTTRLSCSSILSSPKDPAFAAHFVDYENKSLSERIALKVDRWIRKTINKT